MMKKWLHRLLVLGWIPTLLLVVSLDGLGDAPVTAQERTPIRVTRIYTGDDGESHFEDVEIPMIDRGGVGQISELQGATGVAFRETDGDYDFDFHNAPRRQYVINLDAAVEIEVGDGSTRRIEAGGILLAEATAGRGHCSRAVDHRPRRCIFVTLD